MLKKWTFLLAATALFLSGCSEKEKVDVKEHKPAEVNGGGKELEEVEEFLYSLPLSGVKVEEESNHRAVAVIVNNHPKARPQTGLNKADLVYEALAEGGVTRFVAVFQSEMPDRVGPVRSARDYYVEIAKGFNSFFVAHGYSPEAKAMLLNGYVDNINGMEYDGSLFKRANDRVAPHNSYITYGNIKKGAEKEGVSLNGAPSAFAFLEEEAVPTGEDAASMMVSYGSPSFDVIYEYDAATGKYKRFTGGAQTVDHDSGDPVLLDNIFVVEAGHKVVDNAGRRDINLASGGNGYLIQKGKRVDVTWQNVDGRIVPFKDGAEAGFAPGKTWVNVVPSLQSVSFDAQ